MNAERLTRRQVTVIPLLLTMPVERACEQVKIAKPTVYKWLRQSAFKAELKRLQNELFSDAIGRIKGNVSKAVENLVGLMDSDEEQIQIRACERVIEYAVKLNVNEELEKRIEALEAKLIQQGGSYR